MRNRKTGNPSPYHLRTPPYQYFLWEIIFFLTNQKIQANAQGWGEA